MSEVIVVGAGVVGLAAAHELAHAGHRATVVSADVPGSCQSRGLSRIFRLAHADGELTDAAAASLSLWAEWEARAARPLLDRVGLLLTGDVADREAHLARHGGVHHGSGARHPLAIALERWSYEPTGAAILAEATVRFLQEGVELVLGEVTRVSARGVTLAGGERLDAERVIVCAGADTYGLLGVPEPERMRSVRFSFALRQPGQPHQPVPCWINRDERLCEPFYAVMDGPDHCSIGLSGGEPARLAEAEHVRHAHPRIVSIADRVFPGLRPVAERVVACEFPLRLAAPNPALAHDGWDLIEHDGVLGLTGPALFKFAPLLGQLAARRVDRVAV
ncbi:MAG TPA: FAD-dependent oxidoreductase [Solirubrobacteraceae bacterium]